MKKFVPYDKMSPKQRKEIDRRRRGDWGAISPVSRRVESAKVYNRSKARRWKNETDGGVFLFAAAR